MARDILSLQGEPAYKKPSLVWSRILLYLSFSLSLSLRQFSFLYVFLYFHFIYENTDKSKKVVLNLSDEIIFSFFLLFFLLIYKEKNNLFGRLIDLDVRVLLFGHDRKKENNECSMLIVLTYFLMTIPMKTRICN